MSDFADTESVAYAGVFKYTDNNYGWRANVPPERRAEVGKDQVKRTGYTSPIAAFQARNAFLNGQGDLPSNGMYVRDWAAHWLANVQRSREENTHAGYLTAMERDILPVIGDEWIADLTTDHIDHIFRHMADAGYATATMKATRMALSACLNKAVTRTPALITRNPAGRGFVLPKGKPPKKWRMWTMDEFAKFAVYVQQTPRDEALWTLWCTSALRKEEVAGLMWSKVDWQNNEAMIDWVRTKNTRTGKVIEKVAKTKASEATIPLTPGTVRALKVWRAEQAEIRLRKGDKWGGGDYIFTSARHCPYYPDSLNDRLNTLSDRAGVPRTTPHGLRHAWATRSLKEGVDLVDVQRMLRHERYETTANLYVHQDAEDIRDDVERVSKRMGFG